MSNPEQKLEEMYEFSKTYLLKLHECIKYLEKNNITEKEKMGFISYCNNMVHDHRFAIQTVSKSPLNKVKKGE